MKVLVVPGFAKEAGSANTACVNEVIFALRNLHGADVTITGETLKKARADINWKKDPLFALKKIRNWPVMNPNAADECFRQIEQEIEQASYDAILVCHMPYDGVLAAVRARKKHPDTLLMLYELDPITYEIDRARNSLGKYLYFLREHAEKRTFDVCDVVFHMACNRTKFQQIKYDKYKEKFCYIDFPLIHDLNITEMAPQRPGTETIRLLYTGKLMEHFRSPEYLLKVIVTAHDLLNIEIVFFSNGNCESMLCEYASRYPFIKQQGFVEREKLQMEIEACDCLVNIGNKISDMLPSKLLTYIETGKPILHIQNQKKDACVSYLKRYGLAVILSEEDSVDQSAKELADFLTGHYGQLVGSKTIIERFEQNTAAFSAKAIVDSIRTHKQRK